MKQYFESNSTEVASNRFKGLFMKIIKENTNELNFISWDSIKGNVLHCTYIRNLHEKCNVSNVIKLHKVIK